MQDWTNKRIAWYGTSIPAGFPEQSNQIEFAYPNIVADILGATCDNYCVSNGKIRENDAAGNNPVFHTQSFTNTQYITNINYQSKIVNLIGTALEPDLFVFDYGVNDYAYDPSDIDNVAGYDFTSLDTNTFLGSYNKTLKELFIAKPTAKAIILTHYSDDGAQVAPYGTKDCWKKLNDLIVKIGEYWNVPVKALRKDSQIRNANGVNNISVYCPDLIHPASDPNAVAVNEIARICAEFIKDSVPMEQATTTTPTPNPTPTPPTGSINRTTAMYMQTGQPLSFITGDAADVVYGRSDDFLNLDSPPLHGDGSPTINTTNYRFTDESGGQDFNSGIILDWSSWNGFHVAGFQNSFLLNSPVGVYSSFESSRLFTSTFTLGGFANWHQVNLTELLSVSMKKYNCFDYPPFNYTGPNLLWTSNTLSQTIAIVLRTDTFEQKHSNESSNAGRPFPCRYFTLSLSNILS